MTNLTRYTNSLSATISNKFNTNQFQKQQFPTPRTDKQAVPLARAWNRLAKEAQISSVGSSAKTVFCTRNFLFGTANFATMSSIDDYLRPVDSALVFTNGDMMVLSERETNGVLLALAKSRGQGDTARPTAKLVHLSYAGVEEGESRINTNPLMRDAVLHTRKGHEALSCAALARIWVFGGTTTIPVEGREAVRGLVKGKRLAVRHIVAARDHMHMLPRSDLERLLA